MLSVPCGTASRVIDVSFDEVRLALPAVLWSALVVGGCAPNVPVSVLLDACLEAEMEVALAVESGPCGARAAVASTAPLGDSLEPLPPGRYCVDALAYRRDDEARICRLGGLDRENRRFPEDREPLVLEVGCAPPALELGDDLLAGVAGCNGRCDVDRCVCAAGCDPLDPDAECPTPVSVERVVISDHVACGLAADRRSFWCWGDELAGALTDGSSGPSGVARVTYPIDDATNEYVLYDAGPDLFCAHTATGGTRCGPEVRREEGLRVRGLSAVGEGFLCRGEMARVGCWSLASNTATILPFAFPTDLSAARRSVCGIVAGEVYCASPTEDCAADGECWWGRSDCDLEPRTAEPACVALVPASTFALPEVGFIDIDLGWDRGCAVDSAGRLACWSERGGDPAGLPVPTPSPGPRAAAVATTIGGFEGAAWIREVSVGESHLCVRRIGGVECGVIEVAADGAFVLARREPFPGDGVIGAFAAGPNGISCAVRVVEGGPSRLECFQLAGFSGGEALLGRAHTRDRATGVDPDRGDLAVCP